MSPRVTHRVLFLEEIDGLNSKRFHASAPVVNETREDQTDEVYLAFLTRLLSMALWLQEVSSCFLEAISQGFGAIPCCMLLLNRPSRIRMFSVRAVILIDVFASFLSCLVVIELRPNLLQTRLNLCWLLL